VAPGPAAQRRGGHPCGERVDLGPAEGAEGGRGGDVALDERIGHGQEEGAAAGGGIDDAPRPPADLVEREVGQSAADLHRGVEDAVGQATLAREEPLVQSPEPVGPVLEVGIDALDPPAQPGIAVEDVGGDAVGPGE
jgi:hypothetical protein